MKAFIVACALFAAATAAPNAYGGAQRSSSYGGGETRQLQPAGSPSVRMVSNSDYRSASLTYTAPGQTYQAAPVTYAAPMLTFTPPELSYSGQSVAYATASSDGYGGNTRAYQSSESYRAPANPTVENYQPSASSAAEPQKSSGY